MTVSELRRLAVEATSGPWEESGGIWHGEDIVAQRIHMDADAALIVAMRNGLPALLACADALERAAYVAEHLHAMIPQEVWRDTGGDDGQGHYEGDYHAEKTLEEIRAWAVLAALDGEQT